MAALRVLELGGYAAGYAGRHFVRAGFDVVRLDLAAPPPAWASPQAMENFLHAGKRRVTLSEKPDAFLNTSVGALVGAADIVVCEASSAGEIETLGYHSWTDVLKVAITPYGLTGPKRDWVATPSTILAEGGYTYLLGDPDRAPLSLPGHYLEFQSGTLAYAAALSGLYAAGSQAIDPAGIDIGMFETVMALSQFTTVRWHCAGEIRSRHGSDFWFVAPSELFPLADGWVYVNIVPAFWDPFVLFLDRPELAADPRFDNNDLRMENREALHACVGEALKGMTQAEAEARARQFRVPVGVVRTLENVLDETHLQERQFWETVSFEGRELRLPGLVYRLNGEPRPVLDGVQEYADD